jgi:hypothetical protein
MRTLFGEHNEWNGDVGCGAMFVSFLAQLVLVPLAIFIASIPFSTKPSDSCIAALPLFVPVMMALGLGAAVGHVLPVVSAAGRFVWCGPAVFWIGCFVDNLPRKGLFGAIKVGVCGGLSEGDAMALSLFTLPLAACLAYGLGMHLAIRSWERELQTKAETRPASSESEE